MTVLLKGALWKVTVGPSILDYAVRQTSANATNIRVQKFATESSSWVSGSVTVIFVVQ